VRVVTGKDKDYATDKILKGDSVKNYPQKAAAGDLAQWEKEIKTKEIWDLTYDDNLWADDEDLDNQDLPVIDYNWMSQCDPAKTFWTCVNSTGRRIKKGEQIFRCYGRQSNLGLLLNYGFAYHDNPYDYVEVK